MPNINYSQGTEYFCDIKMIDLEYDSDACWDEPQLDKCRQCSSFCKQDYTIVVQDKRFKKFI
jgi:hypothetical protein